MITVSVSKRDIDAWSRRAMRYSQKVKVEVAKDLAEGALNIRNEAVSAAPVNVGRLRTSIYAQKERASGLLWSVGTKVKYAPYMEFGTGQKVSLKHLIRAGFPTSFAAQFKGKGVKQVNIQPRPFLFPAYNREVPLLKKRIKRTLVKNGKKI